MDNAQTISVWNKNHHFQREAPLNEPTKIDVLFNAKQMIVKSKKSSKIKNFLLLTT